ncbi:hypothetical protein [Salirhabdus sp. Marseille-P4669]|uniref:hypothetical protein n=1 Tax=Salirhabdus sp. Marseille-P4669 TaxID=2042310 RepID=UPI000C7B2BDF|nr:hypothetical protein [Salirhabdus sp. Marseille-P4669]
MIGRRKKEVWVNIDIPTRKFTIHTECTYTKNMKETEYKGIERLKRDGGWVSFKSKDAAIKCHNQKFEDYSVTSHCG